MHALILIIGFFCCLAVLQNGWGWVIGGIFNAIFAVYEFIRDAIDDAQKKDRAP